MKCDELKAIKQGSVEFGEYWVYDAEEVDAAIAELKAENKMLKEHIANGDVSRITWIDDVIELKQKLHDAEMRADLAEAAETERKIDYDNLKKDLSYHARQIYFKHNRQTLRALWLARAYRAGHCTSVFYFVPSEYLNTPLNIYGYADKDIGMERMLKPRRWMKIWNNVERLCRAKADTFKEDV